MQTKISLTGSDSNSTQPGQFRRSSSVSGYIAEAIKSDSTTPETSLLGRNRRLMVVVSVDWLSLLNSGSIKPDPLGDFVAGTVSEAPTAGVDRGDSPESLSWLQEEAWIPDVGCSSAALGEHAPAEAFISILRVLSSQPGRLVSPGFWLVAFRLLHHEVFSSTAATK